MNQNAQLTDDTINLRELFFTLLTQWKLIVFCTVFTLVCAAAYLKVAKRTYSVDAKIQIIDNKQNGLAGLNSQLAALGSLAGMSLGSLGNQQSIQTEIEILQSRSILAKTIQDLNLDIQIQPEQSLLNKLLSTDQFQTNYTIDEVQVKNHKAKFSIHQFNIPKQYLDQNLILNFHGQSFNLISEKTGLEVFKGTVNQKTAPRLLKTTWTIDITSPQPLEGRYIVQKQSILTATKAILEDFKATELGKQTGIITINYEGADKDHIIKVLNHILEIYQEQNLATKSAEKEKTLSFLNQQLPELKNNLEQAERKFNAFREAHGTIDIQQESALYLKQSVELETQKVQLEQKQAELAAQYTAQHPMMQEINAQLGVFNKKINELNGALKKLPNTQSQYLQYYRDVQVQTQLYTNLLGTYQSLNLAKAGETGNLRILDYPVEPTRPIKPRKLIILVLSIFVGGFIGILIALIRNMLKTGVRNRDEIEQTVGVKTYAELSEISKKSNASLQSLKTFIPTLTFKLQQRQHNVTLISSIVPDQNQNIIAQHLALYLSQTGKKVLLIDSDLYRGQLDQLFNISTKPGLCEYLRGQVSLEQIVTDTASPNLSLIVRGQSSDEISISSHQTHIAQLIQQVRAQYDYIILSAAPVLTISDSLTLAQFTGFNLCLVQYGQTQLKDIELAKSYFENAGLEIDGLILDQVPAYQTKQYQYQPN
ncbi:GNVR domain-containing protein [Acinetobacter sp. VNH17]|uniref:non-specific protein-tyrosine kinase n=1 Tax=Acinetobacter thutiue TaxID=2998078 RepID=A0ABT7WSG2_9GAMM|nr:GNVR domain-containing protein [Acinetobacter thutiue]MCY6413494.1 Wzz/FepE/Etk N-terminal domain-containing protein [Acinetobacter thutiue]MDN0015603.1 GNVR domain-containing protein [Acinetobacter thutiue]